MKRLLLFISLLAAAHANAQYFQFSQYNFASQRITPTAVVSSNYAKMSFLYRNQSAAGDIKLNSNFFSGSYPFISKITGKRWSGVGFTFMDDRSGGIFNTNEVTASYGLTLPINNSQFIAIAFKGLYQQRKINLSGLFTESQFIPDRGFDPSITNGETIGIYRNNYVTFSSGLSWQKEDKNGNQIAYSSISFFDLNKPSDSFFDGNDSRLNSTIVFALGFKGFESNNLALFPEVLLTRNNAITQLNSGFVTRYSSFDRKGNTNYKIDLITKYVVQRSAIAGLQFDNEKIVIGFSYDFLINRKNVSNLNAFELGLELKKLIHPKKSFTKRQNNKKPMVKRSVNNPPRRKSSLTDKPTQEKNDSLKLQRTVKGTPKTLNEKLKDKHDSLTATADAGKISHEPLMLEKIVLRFNFEFNSVAFSDESTTFLDDLAEALKQDEHLTIKLTGHTDNIGSLKFNQKLSELRAQAVKDYLFSKGIDPTRIEVIGKGMMEPLNSNKTETERAENRRVELNIFYKD